MARAYSRSTKFSATKNTKKGNKKTIKVTRKKRTLADVWRKYFG